MLRLSQILPVGASSLLILCASSCLMSFQALSYFLAQENVPQCTFPASVLDLAILARICLFGFFGVGMRVEGRALTINLILSFPGLPIHILLMNFWLSLFL